MGLLIICFAVTNPIPLHPKIVKTKVWDFIFLHKIGGGSAIKVNFIALTLHYLCPKKNIIVKHKFIK